MAVPLLAGGIIASVAAGIAKIFAEKAIAYAAFKLLLFALIMVVLPLALMNLIEWWMVELLDMSKSYIENSDLNTSVQGVTISLTGVSAYLADRLQVPLAFSMVMSANVFRMVLNFIPFVG